MLTDILKFVRKHQQASLLDISIHFQIDSAALEPMMDILLRKDKVRLFGAECSSGSCSGCSCSSRENMMLYTLVTDERKVKHR